MTIFKNKGVVFSWLLLIVLFFGGAFGGWVLANGDWTLRPLFAFVGAFLGGCIWVLVMLTYGIWEDYKDRTRVL